MKPFLRLRRYSRSNETEENAFPWISFISSAVLAAAVFVVVAVSNSEVRKRKIRETNAQVRRVANALDRKIDGKGYDTPDTSEAAWYMLDQNAWQVAYVLSDEDSWKSPLVALYGPPGGGEKTNLKVVSAGPDGEYGTGDDIDESRVVGEEETIEEKLRGFAHVVRDTRKKMEEKMKKMQQEHARQHTR